MRSQSTMTMTITTTLYYLSILGQVGIAHAAAATSSSCHDTTPKLQVLSHCQKPVFCTSFDPYIGETVWREISKNTVVEYAYATSTNLSTVWCARDPSGEAYSFFSLKKLINTTDEYPAVEYNFGTAGNQGLGTDPPFLNDGISIIPIEPTLQDISRFGCPVFQCKKGELGCMQQVFRHELRCSASVTVRLNLCSSPNEQDTTTTSSISDTAISSTTAPATTFRAGRKRSRRA